MRILQPSLRLLGTRLLLAHDASYVVEQRVGVKHVVVRDLVGMIVEMKKGLKDRKLALISKKIFDFFFLNTAEISVNPSI